MKTAALSTLIGFAVGLAVSPFIVSKDRSSRPQPEENPLLRIEEAQSTPQALAAERDQWKREAETFKERSEEVHQLRAEVSRLQRELADAQSAELKKGMVSPQQKENTAPLPEKKSGADTSRHAVLFENAPAAVQATLARETRLPTVQGLTAVATEEGLRFDYKGKFEDGKGIYLRLREDGTVLARRSEIPAEALPSHIWEPITQSFGSVPIHGVTEIIQNGELAYELVSKGQAGATQISIREDGTITGYSTVWKRDETKPKVARK